MIDGIELRFGNLFYWSDPEMDERKGKRTVGIVKASNIGDSEFMDAIPLTEEWLLKFGFHDFIGVWNSPKKDKNHYHLVKRDDIWVFRGLGASVVEVKTVNHLQNLYYFLTFQELEVK